MLTKPDSLVITCTPTRWSGAYRASRQQNLLRSGTLVRGTGMTRQIRTSRVVAALASGALVAAGLAATASPAANAADQHPGTPGVKVTKKDLGTRAAGTARPRGLQAKGAAGEPGDALPAGVPSKGRYAFLLELSSRSTSAAYHGALGRGKSAA